MTFTQIVARIADRLNLTSATAITRIGEEVNERYREVCSGVGLQTSIRSTISLQTTIGNRNVIATCEKIFSVFNSYGRPVTSITRSGTTATVTTSSAHGYGTGASAVITGAVETDYNGTFVIMVTGDTTFTYTVSGSPTTPATGTIASQLLQVQWILGQRTPDELRAMSVQADPPQNWATLGMGASTVTIMLDSIPSTVYILGADVEVNLDDISGSEEPNFPQDFHDILERGGMADELYKMEKYDLAEKQETKFEKRLGELRLFISKSNALSIYQGRDRQNGYVQGAGNFIKG